MFEALKPTKPDAIIKMIAMAAADPNPGKIDLGVGVYQDETGATPIMRAVKRAEQQWFEEEQTKKYIGIRGNPAFNAAFAALIFGAESDVIASDRLALAQAAGGSGALRVGTELIKLANPHATVWVSTPTWANHTPLIGSTGLQIAQYPYYNKETQAIDFEDMCETLHIKTKPGDVLLLHGCCHNPTGANLSPEQWQIMVDLINENKLMPFVDLAYAGLGDGMEADLYGTRLVADQCEEFVFAGSCSKNFGLYRERVGLVAAKAKTPDQARLCEGQLALTTRKMISMPPDHGAAIVAKILTTPDLCADWLEELETMRNRMNGLRQSLSEALNVQGRQQMASALASQRGMFSLLPVTPEQAATLRDQHSVYLLDSGRINIAGVRQQTVEPLAESILAVL